MNKTIKDFIKIGIIILSIVCLLACQSSGLIKNETNDDGEETLETFFEKPINKFAIKQLTDAMSQDEDFNSVEISFDGNKVIYTLYCKDYLGKGEKVEKTMRKYIEANRDVLFSELRNTIDLDGDYIVEYVYYNNDYSKAADITVYENMNSDENLYNENFSLADIDDYSEKHANDKDNTINSPKPDTLEYVYNNYYGNDDDNEYLNSYRYNLDGVFSDIDIECSGNTISYSFYFIEDMGDVQQNVEYNMNDDEKRKIIDSIKNFFSFYNTITVKYIYYNPDGTVAAKIQFEG